jgi:TfoX/Sxy family transcriptional regulator of competence genes
MSSPIAELESQLNKTAQGLSKLSAKKMFGCHALFANENVFGLVWKHGRIGVKLTNAKDFEKLMALDGAEPWKAGPMTMSHWILVPEAVAASAAKLKPWVHLAHAQALTAPPKAPKKPSAKPAKKSAAKKRK